MTTQILALVDALGNLVGFHLLPGQRHDICGVEPLIRDRECGALLADKAFDADWLVKDLAGRGGKVVIPPRSNRKALREYGKEMYMVKYPKNRNGVAPPCRTICTVCGGAPGYVFLAI